jgi:hypothetical protein
MVMENLLVDGLRDCNITEAHRKRPGYGHHNGDGFGNSINGSNGTINLDYPEGNLIFAPFTSNEI